MREEMTFMPIFNREERSSSRKSTEALRKQLFANEKDTKKLSRAVFVMDYRVTPKKMPTRGS